MRAAFHVQLLLRFASGWIGRSVDWAGYGSVRFSHSFCLFWLLCLKSILPKCGWINFMLFDSLLNTKKQQITKKKQKQIYGQKKNSKKCGCQWMKLLLTLNRRARVNEVALSDWLCVSGSSVSTEVESSWSRKSKKNKGLLTLKTGKWSFAKLKCEYRVTWRAS